MVVSAKELRLDTENAKLRQLLAQAGIDAAEQKVMEGLQRLLLEELHPRIKNVLHPASFAVLISPWRRSSPQSHKPRR